MTPQHQPYVSVLSVVEDIHSMIPSSDWDEDSIIEWVLKGYRSLDLNTKFENHVVFIKIEEHTGMLPLDTIHINQMFYRKYPTRQTTEELIEAMAEITGITPDKPFYKHMFYKYEFLERLTKINCFVNHYKPLQRSSSTFGVEPCHDGVVPNSGCLDLYQVNNFVITTTFKEGCIVLSYKRYFKDENGYDMIPDNEKLKQALFHFAMFRHSLSRAMAKEEGMMNMAEYHRSRFNLLSAQAKGQLMLPDIDTMENLKNANQRLVPRANFYDRAFSNLSNKENINF